MVIKLIENEAGNKISNKIFFENELMAYTGYPRISFAGNIKIFMLDYINGNIKKKNVRLIMLSACFPQNKYT